MQARVSLATLYGNVRRVGVLHPCLDFLCKPNPNMNSVAHTEHDGPLGGGHFFALTRQDGYPPRRG